MTFASFRASGRRLADCWGTNEQVPHEAHRDFDSPLSILLYVDCALM